jgi:hypothetical protein
MYEAVPPEARANVDGVVVCNESYDDLQTNYFNPSYWIAKAGSRGLLGAQTGNVAGSISGGYSRNPAQSVDPSMQPLLVRNPAEAGKVLDFAGLGNVLGGSAGLEKLLRFKNRLNQSEMGRFSSLDLSAQTKAILGCSSENLLALKGNAAAEQTDPTGDAQISAIFPEINQPQPTDREAQERRDMALNAAPVAKLVLDGLVGAGTITLPG